MKKISTLFKKNPNNLRRVINKVNPENEWAFKEGIPTRKFDGTSCTILNGELYKRYDVKNGRKIPEGAIPCQEADLITGHYPHWLKCDRNKKEDKYFFEAYDQQEEWQDDTYELCGIKIQGNPEKINGHQLIAHGCERINLEDNSFEYLKEYLSNPENDIEGIVFHHKTDNRMCKIRKSDFGVRR
jgi:hypothetical protein